MEIPEKLLEIGEHEGDGYAPVVDYQSWRVAILNFSEQLLPGQLKEMQRHNETDEVFVLLRGRCILFVGDGEEKVTDLMGVDMESLKLYTVKRATWHTHTLDREAKVLIVENRLTTYDNSPFIRLSEAQQRRIIELTNAIWSGTEDMAAP